MRFFGSILRLQGRCFLPTDGAPEHLGDISGLYMGVNPKIGVVFTPKMDGENNGSKPY